MHFNLLVKKNLQYQTCKTLEDYWIACLQNKNRDFFYKIYIEKGIS